MPIRMEEAERAIREVAGRVLMLADEGLSPDEIREKIGAKEILSRPRRLDPTDPVWERMWMVGDVTIWVVTTPAYLCRVIGVYTGNKGASE